MATKNERDAIDVGCQIVLKFINWYKSIFGPFSGNEYSGWFWVG